MIFNFFLISHKSGIYIKEELFDSRYANGILVHLPSGCLAVDGNFVLALIKIRIRMTVKGCDPRFSRLGD